MFANVSTGCRLQWLSDDDLPWKNSCFPNLKWLVILSYLYLIVSMYSYLTYAVFSLIKVNSVPPVTLPWCSGYHVCFTRRRSSVQSWVEANDFSILIHYFNKKSLWSKYMSYNGNKCWFIQELNSSYMLLVTKLYDIFLLDSYFEKNLHSYRLTNSLTVIEL